MQDVNNKNWHWKLLEECEIMKDIGEIHRQQKGK